MPDEIHSGITHQVNRVDGAITQIGGLVGKHPTTFLLLAMMFGFFSREIIYRVVPGEERPADPAACVASLEACELESARKVEALRDLLDRCLPASEGDHE